MVMNQVFPTVFACEVDYNWVESVPMSGKKLDSTFFWTDLDSSLTYLYYYFSSHIELYLVRQVDTLFHYLKTT